MDAAFKRDFMKWFGYFARVATTGVKVGVDGEVITFEPPKAITVSPLLYRSDSCSTGCDKCCYFSWNLWAGCEPYPKAAEMFDITINDCLVKPIFIEPHVKRSCSHRVKRGCAIHDINPIHCRMPHMKFKQVKDKVYITKEQFGRNWALGCPTGFSRYDLGAFNEDINRLTKVKKVAEYFGIETAIDTIIAMVSKGQHGRAWPNYQPSLACKGFNITAGTQPSGK